MTSIAGGGGNKGKPKLDTATGQGQIQPLTLKKHVYVAMQLLKCGFSTVLKSALGKESLRASVPDDSFSVSTDKRIGHSFPLSL